MKKVLVIDANQRSALAATRSLGRHGILVYTAEETPTALASSSRFSKRHFTYPSPRLVPDLFIEALSNLVKEQHIDILLPMTELTTMLLLMNQSAFSEIEIPFPDLDTVESLSDKCNLMKMADTLDIPVPQTWYVDSPDMLPCALEDLPYPIVFKPGKSWLFHEGQWRRAAVRFAGNAIEAGNILDSDWALRTSPFMIQKCIAGHGEGIFAIYDNGRQLALFAHRRLREKPPSGGVSVLSESIPVAPELSSHARKLLENVNWHGVAMVEFKIATDGTPYLMEINTRFWGSLQLAIDAGVDFPYMLYQLACGQQTASVTEYKNAIKLRWLLGDLDNLYLTLKDRHNSLGTRLRALIRFLAPSPLRTKYEINRIGDMKPFWYEIRQYLRDISSNKHAP